MSVEQDILAINEAKNSGILEIDVHTESKTIEIANYTNIKKAELEEKTTEELEKIEETGIDAKQNKEDELLETTSKNVVGAINEIKVKADDNTEQIQILSSGVGLDDNSITLDKLSFAEKSKNLFNYKNVTDGYFIGSTNGELGANDSYTATDYIEVEENTEYSCNIGSHHAWYDEDYVYIQGSSSFSTPELSPFGAKYIRYSIIPIKDKTKSQFEKNIVSTTYEPFWEYISTEVLKPNSIDDNLLKDGTVSYKKTNFMTPGKNLFDGNFEPNKYIVYSTGEIQDNPPYSATDYIEVEAETEYIRSYDHQIAFYDENKTYISGFATTGGSFVTPELAKYARTNFVFGTENSYQFEKGSTKTAYEPFGYEIPLLVIPNENEITSILPSEIYVAEGRTIELYHSQLLSNANVNNLHFRWICGVGKSFKRKFSIEGTSAKIGEYALELEVYDDYLNLVYSASSTVKIVDGIANATKILTIGDSLSNGKPWLQELVDLSDDKITMVGTKGIAPIQHEGYSGWSANSFLTAMDIDVYQGTQYTLNVSGIVITPVVGKEYTINGYKFSVVSTSLNAGEGTITIDRINLGSISLTSGVLIEVDSEIIGDSSISYTNAVGVPMNPFWDGSKFNYNYYKTENSINPNVVQIFLGTNGISINSTSNATNIKQIVEYIRQDDSTIPIMLVNTLYRGDQNGIGNQTATDGYNASNGQFKQQEDRKVFNLIKQLQSDLDEYTNLYFVNLAQCHDSEFNYGNVETIVNPRSAITLPYAIEATHPQLEGYMQFADIMYSTVSNIYN